jgi:hypothetical protein
MEGNKTTVRRSRRTASSRVAPAAARKEPAKPRVAKPKPSARTDVVTSRAPQEKLRMVEMAAYFRAERRGFEPGHEIEDWIAAEAEIDAQFAAVPEKKPARRARKAPSN